MSNEELINFLRKNVISVACALVSIGIGIAIYMRSDLLPEAEKVLRRRPSRESSLQPTSRTRAS